MNFRIAPTVRTHYTTREKVLIHVAQHPGTTQRDIRNALPEIPRRTIFTALSALMDAGHVREAPSLRDARQYRYWVVTT